MKENSQKNKKNPDFDPFLAHLYIYFQEPFFRDQVTGKFFRETRKKRIALAWPAIFEGWRKTLKKNKKNPDFDPFLAQSIYIYIFKSPFFVRQLVRNFFGELAKNELLQPIKLFLKIVGKL